MTEDKAAKPIYEPPILVELGELARGYGQGGGQCAGGSIADSPGANACTGGNLATCGQPGPPKCCQSGSQPQAPPEAGSSTGGGSGFDTGSTPGDDSASGEGSGFSVP